MTPLPALDVSQRDGALSLTVRLPPTAYRLSSVS